MMHNHIHVDSMYGSDQTWCPALENWCLFIKTNLENKNNTQHMWLSSQTPREWMQNITTKD